MQPTVCSKPKHLTCFERRDSCPSGGLRSTQEVLIDPGVDPGDDLRDARRPLADGVDDLTFAELAMLAVIGEDRCGIFEHLGTMTGVQRRRAELEHPPQTLEIG